VAGEVALLGGLLDATWRGFGRATPRIGPVTRIPDLFIIGAAKSGTTSLYEYLRAHPQVFMSPIKEPTYFAPDLPPNDVGRVLRHAADEEAYLELFAEAGAALRVGEASVRYLYSHAAPRLIAEFQPRPYVVAILRNPVDMIASLHAHRLADGTEDLADLAEAVAAEDDRRAGRRVPPRSTPLWSVYTDRARYGEQLSRWYDAIDAGRIHVMVFEEFVREPELHYRRLLEFLEVDPEHRPAEFEAHNRGHASRSRRLRRLLHARFPQWLVWQAMPRLLGQNRTRALVASFRHSRFQRQAAERPPLPIDVRLRLEALFEDDVSVLSRLIGRDMNAAWFRQAVPVEEVASGG
jgi:hypothetical protein